MHTRPRPFLSPSPARSLAIRASLTTLVLGLTLPLPAALVVQIGQNFTGSTYGIDSFDRPADGDGAIGPSHFVELINGRFSVYSKTSGARVQTLTDTGFWTGAGLTFPSGAFVSDPRVLFDKASQRWFASAIDVPTSFQNNRFLLAVSASADPTGVWKAVAFIADPTTGLLADFPTLGLDADGVYLSGNLFPAAGAEIRPLLVAIPKADLLAPVPSAANRTSFNTLSYATRGEILQPVVNQDGTGGGERVVAVSSLGYDFAAHSDLILSTVLNAAGPGAATLTPSTTVPTPPYYVPINPPQPNPSAQLDDGDARIGAVAYRVNGLIYAVHAVEVNPAGGPPVTGSQRASLQWFKLDAGTGALLQSGTITDGTLDLFFPSIAANTNGTVVIGCNGCNAASFVSSYAIVGETVGGVTTFGAPQLLQAGTASYNDPPPNSGGVSRWGDYSATSVDPLDANRFWTLQMVPTSATVWTTRITELITGPLELTIASAGTSVILSWPTGAGLFHLESTPQLDPVATWFPVPEGPVTNAGRISVTVPLAGQTDFFRLKQP